MDEDEVLSQMAYALLSFLICLIETYRRRSAILLAGHDTSAASLTWLMLELAKHPEDQERIASEIQHLREETGGRTLTPADYDDMPYLNAVIKVCRPSLILFCKALNHLTGSSPVPCHLTNFISKCRCRGCDPIA